jgi:hypothetical protein
LPLVVAAAADGELDDPEPPVVLPVVLLLPVLLPVLQPAAVSASVTSAAPTIVSLRLIIVVFLTVESDGGRAAPCGPGPR